MIETESMKINFLYLHRDMRLISFKVGPFGICTLLLLFLPGLEVSLKLSNSIVLCSVAFTSSNLLDEETEKCHRAYLVNSKAASLTHC
jgi:hypothetical protein